MEGFFSVIYESQDGWKWLILAMVLAIGEVFAPGVFLIWIAGAAAITGMVSLLFDMSLTAQLILAATLSVLAVALAKYWYDNNTPEASDPLLNNRSARLIGKIVKATEDTSTAGGRAQVGDSTWPARISEGMTPIKAGEKAEVIDVENGVLILKTH